MRVSHECPIDMLEDSIIFNDYEYSLLHLMHIDKYREFYKKQAKKRYQILDNSAFEYQFIGKKFDVSYFIEIINEIKPSSIIIPDVIGDKDGTIDAFNNFNFSKLNYKPEIIGVVQGQTYKELTECAKFMHKKVNKMAIVFHSPAYQVKGMNKDLCNAIGRIKFVESLKGLNIPLHLLGCSLPWEFAMHTNKDIDTVDTANPIQFGLMGGKYPEIHEVKEKPKYLMSEENIQKITQNNDIINHNIKKFRNLICE